VIIKKKTRLNEYLAHKGGKWLSFLADPCP